MTSLTTRKLKSKIEKFMQDEEAASAAEYGILAALVAVAIIAAVQTFGTTLKNTFTTMTGKLPAGNGA